VTNAALGRDANMLSQNDFTELELSDADAAAHAEDAAAHAEDADAEQEAAEPEAAKSEGTDILFLKITLK